MLDGVTLAALLGLHCQLTLSFQSGTQASCSAQIIAPNTLLTAEHCVVNGMDRNPLVIAECGAKSDRTFYMDTIQKPPPRLSQTDHVFLVFEPTPEMPRVEPETIPRTARYPALYFELNGALKSGTTCFAINRHSEVLELTANSTTLRYDRTTRTIRSSPQSSDQILVPGDSGSPLYCKSPAFPQLELIGVTSTVLSPRDSSHLIGNRFTTFFR